MTQVVVYLFNLLQRFKKPNGGNTSFNKTKYVCSYITYQAAIYHPQSCSRVLFQTNYYVQI